RVRLGEVERDEDAPVADHVSQPTDSPTGVAPDRAPRSCSVFFPLWRPVRGGEARGHRGRVARPGKRLRESVLLRSAAKAAGFVLGTKTSSAASRGRFRV